MATLIGHLPAASLFLSGKSCGRQHTRHHRYSSNQERKRQNPEFGKMPHLVQQA